MDRTFDRGAAVTRSLLGWGVVAGPVYLVVGLAQALTRPGFELSRHPLSVLMLGDGGWVQTLNLVLCGLMVVAAAVGLARALRGSRAGTWVGALVGVFGASMVASAIAPPDPMAGFPPGTATGDPTLSGLLHLVFGAVGFLCLAAAALVFAGWLDGRARRTGAAASRLVGAVVAAGFVGGGALSARAAGVVALWVAVVTGFAWLTAGSVAAYRTVLHPEAGYRTDVTAFVERG